MVLEIFRWFELVGGRDVIRVLSYKGLWWGKIYNLFFKDVFLKFKERVRGSFILFVEKWCCGICY